MMLKRSVAVAVLMSALAACATGGAPGAMSDRNSPGVRATAAQGARNYEKTVDAILAADLDAVVAKARASGANGPSNAAVASIVVMDELAAGRPSSARAMLDTLPERYRGGAGDLLEAWVYLGEGDAAKAVERAREGAPRLPGRLGNVLVGLIQESSGDLAAADETYARIESTLDVQPPPEDEPNSLEEAIRQLAAPQTTQILYRAALVKQRLGKKDEALRLYGLVEKFAPNSPDLAANRARAARGEGPLEPALDRMRGLGRWALFLSEEFGRTEGLQQAINDPGPTEGLVSPSSALFSQIGVALDPSATDWTIGAAYTLMGAKGYAGAERLIRRVPANDVYAPDAAVASAELAVRQDDFAKAASEAQRALRLAPERWTIALSAASVLTRAGKDAPALAAYDSALAKATTPRDRATVFIARAASHHYFGRVERAVDDGRAAIAADPRADVRIAAVSYLLDAPDGWTEAVRIGRELLTEKPESVSRLNQLGYTLIHRPEGLEEGYRLLSRGVAMGEHDYAVVDSLGWAYYLYGDFEQALTLIERSNELSPEPNAEILDHLGDVYWRLNQQDKARETWKAALAAKPEARRRAALEGKVANGLSTPAPERRRPPTLEQFTPGQRSDT
jgi:tetratricopeptide (TPR) repeat protein